jgi:hypothetical protein
MYAPSGGLVCCEQVMAGLIHVAHRDRFHRLRLLASTEDVRQEPLPQEHIEQTERGANVEDSNRREKFQSTLIGASDAIVAFALQACEASTTVATENKVLGNAFWVFGPSNVEKKRRQRTLIKEAYGHKPTLFADQQRRCAHRNQYIERRQHSWWPP